LETVAWPTQQLRAIWRWLSPNESSLSTSRILRMGNLSCGNLDLHLSVETQAPLVYPARFMKTALENHSGDADRHSGKRQKLIGFPPEW